MNICHWTVLHQMRYETDGTTEVWICDECGKRVRVTPDFAILEHGDAAAVHWGSHGGLTIRRVEIQTEPAA
mgnify:CR=1 FL=1